MAHFAELDENNIVKRVIVVDNDCLVDEFNNESEQLGIAYCAVLLGGRWIQTSYNANFRNKFAAIGDFYDELSDQFVARWWINSFTEEPFTEKEWEYILNYSFYTTTYRLWAAIPPADETDWLTQYCNSTSLHTYVPLDYLTHGTYALKTDVGNAITFDDQNKMHVNIFFSHTKRIDLGSIGVVMEECTDFFDYDIARRARQLHPQVAASTPHEFFRLLLEWDYCYSEFNNREPAAKLSHDALEFLKMPIAVRNELLLSVPNQAVARYVHGLEPFIGPTSIPCPPLFAKWYEEIKS